MIYRSYAAAAVLGLQRIITKTTSMYGQPGAIQLLVSDLCLV